MWDFRDGNNYYGASPTHVYNYGSTGIYYPSLTVTNSKGCTTTVTATNAITVYPKPVVSFTTPTSVFCTPTAVVSFSSSVSNGKSPYTYAWDYGDGGGYGAGSSSGFHGYTSPGNFSVKLKVTDANGCQDSAVRTGFVSTHQNNASFSGPSFICAAIEVDTGSKMHYISNATFTNTTPNATYSKTYWDFGDNTSGTDSSISHIYITPGTYTVRMVTQVGPCMDTVTHTLVVNPNPHVSVTRSPDPNCPAPTTINFSATGAFYYNWSFASGPSFSIANPSVTYSQDGFYDTVKLIASNATGCADTIEFPVAVHNIDLYIVGPDSGCAPLTIGAHVEMVDRVHPTDYRYPDSIISYYWQFGDGDTSTAPTTVHTYTNPGIYKRIVKIVTSNGCTVIDTSTVKVGNKIKPSFTITPDTVCPHETVYFANTTPFAASDNLNYFWNLGVAYTIVNGRDATADFPIPGTFDITLYADSNGCYDSTICLGCLTVLPANANFTDSAFCPPNNLQVAFNNESVGATSNLWTFGDGTTSTAVNPIHTFPAAGIYTVTLFTTNNIHGCSDTMRETIRVSDAGIDFHTSDSALCKKDTLKIQASATGSFVILGQTWYINNKPFTPGALPPNLKYYVMNPWSLTNEPNGIDSPIVGFHDVMLISKMLALGQGICYDTVIKPHFFFVSEPIPDFSVSSRFGCTPFPAIFYDSTKYTPGTSRRNMDWTFGDGSWATSTAPSIIHTYVADGFYTIKLKATDLNGCADSITKLAYVEARRPNAFYQIPKLTSCVGQKIAFTNLSVGSSTLIANWDFGDGDTAASFYTSHTYKAIGTYTARLVVFDSTGCSDTMSKVISVTKPKAAFSVSDTLAICPPLIVKFTSSATGASKYLWDFKNSGSSSIANPTSTFSAAGVYDVQLIVTDGNGCTDTAIHQVRVLGYAGAFDYPIQNGCAPLTVNFQANIVGAPTMTWDFADGTAEVAVGFTTSHTYLYPGVYVPKLIFSDTMNGCKTSSVGLDTIKVDAVIAGFKAIPPCEKTEIALIDTSFSYYSKVTAWRWNFGAAGTATGNPVLRTYPKAGIYPVTLIATNAQGCIDTVTQNLEIFPLPKVVAMPDTFICVPDAIYLTASGAKTYLWQPPNNLSCTNCYSPRANPNAPINYIVTGTDSNGCMNKDTLKIGIQTKTTFKNSGDGSICLGDKIQLFAIGATMYDWAPPETLDSPKSAHPFASPKTNTNYMVIGQEGSCLADTQVVHIVVHPVPTVDAGADVKIIAGTTTFLQASGSGISGVMWSGDSSLSCYICFAPEAKPRRTTTYYVKAYNDFGCTSTDSVRVFLLCHGSQLFIPNTFSPNGDGHNDRFFPRGEGIKLINSFRIYSRWGELLYERKNMEVNDESAGWDGIRNGRILNPDVFVYVIEATCDSDAPILFKGDVTLLK